MGNSSSSSGRNHQDEAVDFGSLSPQWFTGPRDWNQAVVSQLICQRKLAPFYRPLEEFDSSWDDDQILAARKEPVDATGEAGAVEAGARIEAASANPPRPGHSRRPNSIKEPVKPEAAIYRNAVECPICFLYYPPNINHSRCCDQAICTECFVQIKRNEPTTTHLVSEPAACPYCVQDNFGVVYTAPPWRAGIGSEGSPFPWSDAPKASPSDTRVGQLTHKRRQKSFSHDSPDVVTTDQIRPDWEAKLAAVRAAVARRANRRIIMRQVGDRLIPVGVTSGRVHAIGEEGQTEGDNGGRRSRRRHQQPQQGFDQLLGTMGIAGQDLEELMIMEAMRLSLIEHEDQQRKEAEEKRKKEAEEAAQNRDTPEAGTSSLDVPSAHDEASAPSSSSTSNLASFTSTSSQPAATPISSSRTGSPSPSPSRANLLSSNGDASRPNPPPFSTLNAALTTTAAAAAVLGASSAPGAGSVGSSVNGITNVPTFQVDNAPTPAPDASSSSLDPHASNEPLPSSPDTDEHQFAKLTISGNQASNPE
ncbi:SNF1-interacting protein [Pleurotus ostreatus]|uniref:SNF1-interacting protein n=1 Tax=Pleurotus ostreatus TaxID=5322 RepID=A0A8H7A2G9_PLEOS|nr:SNF1-interacting protein [Pleurotus ostreatus]KAF7440773.1 SNF1-interacting protein [Pleurotus ostreatus]KAJ8699823.1 SNF1-interacting protein, variant 2 [Pleurotus ostreatus]